MTSFYTKSGEYVYVQLRRRPASLLAEQERMEASYLD